MSDNKALYHYLLSTDGVSQADRNPSALDPGSVKVDGRSEQDILRFIRDLSRQIRFYGPDNKPRGDWRAFFEWLTENGQSPEDSGFESLLATRDDLPPHLALLFAYLHIFGFVQQDLNRIPSRRLRYYYEDLLGFSRTSPVADQVHILFGLKNSSESHVLTSGTVLDAGKTAGGLSLKYTLDHDLLVSRAAIAAIKTSFTDTRQPENPIVYKAEDATVIREEEDGGWRPFGSTHQDLSTLSDRTESVRFGWAVASPVLRLSEGEREVRLEFEIRSLPGGVHPALNLTPMIEVEYTAESGWERADEIKTAVLHPHLHIEDQEPESENLFTLDTTILIRKDSPGITGYDSSVHGGGFATRWPLVRINILPGSAAVSRLSGFRVDQITIETSVEDAGDLILQNDQSVQPVDGPVLPFGTIPVIGSGFYIGSEEIFGKSLVSLKVKLEWEDPPEDLAGHYNGYGNSEIAPNKFTTKTELLAGKSWDISLIANQTLFSSGGTDLVKEINIPESRFISRTADSSFRRMPELSLAGGYRHSLSQGFIRLVLTGPARGDVGFAPPEAPFEAFGHKTFPVVYTKQAIALSKHDGTGPEPVLPAQPYTPVLKSVRLDYTARETFRPSVPNGIDQYFVQDIFGAAEIGKNDSPLLIPEQTWKGCLYIGLEKLENVQSVSLLIQAEKGSVPGSIPLASGDITWSYLAGNRWRVLAAGDILEESTSGFQKPGLVRLNIGPDATHDHSLMPAGLKWLRASVKDNPEGAAAVDRIAAQAARATLLLPQPGSADLPGYEDHLSAPLPAGSVTSLLPKAPSIKKVEQPYPSFGGRVSETDSAFYRRTSERLRHKNRAVSVWDYERLVLERFPDIYKVKCLSHTDPENHLEPGEVRLVVVPDWRKRLTGNPLQPRSDQYTLQEIAGTIREQNASPFVTVHASNPFYETLLVDCKVSYRPGFDPGYFSAVLNEEIKRFLSPWAYDEGVDIVFGGNVYASEILAFIEEREYVDFVTDFGLYHRHGGQLRGGIGDMEIGLDFVIAYSPEPTIGFSETGSGGKAVNIDFVVGKPTEVAAATRPDTILVSGVRHRIEPLQAEAAGCRGTRTLGIGQMIVGIDFVPIS